jgi:hypothetical protein
VWQIRGQSQGCCLTKLQTGLSVPWIAESEQQYDDAVAGEARVVGKQRLFCEGRGGGKKAEQREVDGWWE